MGYLEGTVHIDSIVDHVESRLAPTVWSSVWYFSIVEMGDIAYLGVDGSRPGCVPHWKPLSHQRLVAYSGDFHEFCNGSFEIDRSPRCVHVNGCDRNVEWNATKKDL